MNKEKTTTVKTPKKLVEVTLRMSWDFTESLSNYENDNGPEKNVAQWVQEYMEDFDFNENALDHLIIKESSEEEAEKQELQDRYIEYQGNKCIDPECEGEDGEGGSISFEGGKVKHECGCGICGKEWTEVYTLSGYIE